MGRVPPLMVVGEGAAKFVREVVWLESLERWLRLGKERSGVFGRRGGSKRNGRCRKGILQQQQQLPPSRSQSQVPALVLIHCMRGRILSVL
jgi:hypothetical protein